MDYKTTMDNKYSEISIDSFSNGIMSASSTKHTVDEAVFELMCKFGHNNMRMLVYFASTRYDPGELSSKMQNAFPESTVFGCSSAGEIVSGKMLSGSIVAMAFDIETLPEVKVEVVENISNLRNLTKQFNSFENYFGNAISRMNPYHYLGIILVDGLSQQEDKLLDIIRDKSNIFFIGGSAGDDFEFRSTYVYANGKAYTDAAVIALLKPAKPFDLIKTQSTREMGVKLVVTKVNKDKQEVIEFNHKPAVAAYAEALGVPDDELAACFPSHPLELKINGESYIRSPYHICGNGIRLSSRSTKGMTLCLLELTDVIDDTKQAILLSKKRLGNISGIILFNCAHRALTLKKRNQNNEYAAIFNNVPTVGFNTYGEQYNRHTTQSATMIVFK